MKSLIEDVAATHEELLETVRWYSANPTLIVEIARAATATRSGPGRFIEMGALADAVLPFAVFGALDRELSLDVPF